MRMCFLAMLLLMMGATICAQQQDVSISVVTIDGHPMITVSNGHSLAIEAFVISVDMPDTSDRFMIHYDVHSNFKHDTAIPPGGSQQVSLPRIVGKELPVPTLKAVVFSDGSILGDGSSAQDLLARRKILLARTEEVAALLRSMVTQKFSREQALAALQDAWKASKEAVAGSSPLERSWNDHVFYMATSNLEHIPSSGGNEQDISKLLNRVSRALDDWNADLKSARPGPPKMSAPDVSTLPSQFRH